MFSILFLWDGQGLCKKTDYYMYELGSALVGEKGEYLSGLRPVDDALALAHILALAFKSLCPARCQVNKVSLDPNSMTRCCNGKDV